MKKCISLLVILAAVFYLTACNEEDFSSKEFYEYIVYLQSGNTDYNEYSLPVHPYTDSEESLGYFSIGCGGSLPNPEKIIVELEQDSILFNRYNRVKYDIDSSKYARLLSKDKYFISQFTVEIPAKNKNQYVKVPIFVNTIGLSPDSVYFIPISIKSVSGGYKVNPDKKDILYQVNVENYYAEQKFPSLYSMNGYELVLDNNNENAEVITIGNEVIKISPDLGSGLIETRIIKPVSKHSVRVLAAKETVGNMNAPTVDELKNKTIVLTVENDNSVTITPFGTIQVDQLDGVQIDGSPWNIYREERINMVDESTYKYFYLRYRYRVQAANGTYPATWQYVQERLRREEI